MIGTTAIAADPAQNDTSPVVATNGASYLVAWKRRPDNASAVLMVARVSASGAVQDPDGVVVDTTTNVFQPIDLCGGPGDDWGFVYTLAESPGGDPSTAHLRTISPK